MSQLPKILLVDDNKDILDLLQFFLKHNGYEVYCASNVDEGIKIIEDKKPSVILLDLSMPDKSGIQLINHYHFQRKLGEKNVLLLTGTSPPPQELKMYLKLGIKCIINKPVKPNELLTIIAKFMK